MRGELWCANAFYLFDAQNAALYLLTDDKTAMRNVRRVRASCCGNGQWSAENGGAHSRRSASKGEIRRLEGRRATPRVKLTVASRSPVLPAPVHVGTG